MNYITNVTISTSYYNRANIHYSQTIQYERVLVTDEYSYKCQTHKLNRHLLPCRRQTARILMIYIRGDCLWAHKLCVTVKTTDYK